jgi:hypothetical protein
MIMKKIILSALFLCMSAAAFSQILPSFQFGVKGGANLAKFSTGNLLSSENTVGYYAGFYARVGAAGINLQPELYLAGKNANLKSSDGSNTTNDVRFTSLDVPILIGTKIGAAGVGFRLNTGPVVSFILDKKQTFSDAAGSAIHGNFKDQAFAWQFGAGLDIASLGVDLRYEQGLTKLGQDGYQANRLSLFTVGLAYRLF